MFISELIIKLEEAKNKYGDKDILMENNYGYGTKPLDVYLDTTTNYLRIQSADNQYNQEIAAE